MNTNIAAHIQDLLVVCNEMLKAEGVDKVAVRRTRSALETAYYCAMGIGAIPSRNGDSTAATRVGQAGINVTSPVAGSQCICPAGARNRGCPAQIHTS